MKIMKNTIQKEKSENQSTKPHHHATEQKAATLNRSVIKMTRTDPEETTLSRVSGAQVTVSDGKKKTW